MRLLIGFDLLDRQIVDRDGVPVGKVDDVELSDDARHVTALLTGQSALGGRFGGVLGRWITATTGGAEPRRIPYGLVALVDSAVHLSIKRALLTPPALEAWLDQHLIGRIPGADRAEG
ncbi:PRC-barrel domain-containing protein [Actinoplanes sp. LDG1-06]|uniref:PRC-barrel domain-containing protein n=1 Tax=Paractinoplanes ovalisporus TaxID=2810368 RepID=A0ABS2A763_9ACTN|nr:PRC-barrel domain-containing protein [Actinoplanes ovalisporus]MBM2615671.1 PRC-barrel domain-containing protein [Actinoplanes ovalisporus]